MTRLCEPEASSDARTLLWMGNDTRFVDLRQLSCLTDVYGDVVQDSLKDVVACDF